MPLSKRHLPEVEEESDDEISSDDSLSQGAEKRPRISAHQGHNDEVGYARDGGTEGLPSTQLRHQLQETERGKNLPSENGIIESITFTNFMCHAFLEVTLGPLINFIIGHNGSGKSAVLTAITICLGGKASSTNRAGSLKSFIKEGQESCLLSVKLKNQGNTGYYPEVYGKSIIIERHFHTSGTSGFRLKSSAGRVISTKKSDLEDICDYFALQLENPMSVLTQDMARQFLSNSNPQDKYKFFMKGVQLEQLNQDYQLIEENIDHIESTFVEKRSYIENLRQKMARARQLRAMLDEHDNMREKIKLLGHQMAWSQVETEERDLERCDESLNASKKMISAMDYKVDSAGRAFEGADVLHADALRVAESLRTKLTPLLAQADIEGKRFNAAKLDAKSVQTDQRTIGTAIKAEDDRIQGLKEDIQHEYRRLEEANGGHHSKRLADLDALKVEVVDAKERLAHHKKGWSNLESNKQRAIKERDNALTSRREKDRDVEVATERLLALKADSGQCVGAYPTNMTQLCQSINRDNGFKQKPIGPMGESIQLLKPVWSSILEKSFGASLNSFVVTSMHDQARLATIMKRVGCSYPILIGSANAFDYSGHEPDPNFDTSARVLEIDNPLVARQLVISQAIEQTILIEDMTKAVDTMNQQRLRNVKQCFSVNNKGSSGAGVRLTYGWEGALSSSFVEAYRGAPRMKTDIEQQISFHEVTIKRLQAELDELDRVQQAKQNDLKECTMAIARHEKEEKRINQEIYDKEKVVNNLQDALESDAVEEGRLDAYQRALLSAEKDKKSLEDQYEVSVVTRDKHMESMNKCREEMNAVDSLIKEAGSEVKEAEAQVAKFVKQRLALIEEKNNATHRLELARQEKDEKQKARGDQVARVTSFIQQASQVCSRVSVDPKETSDTLETKLQKLTLHMKKFQARLGGDNKTIEEDCTRAIDSYSRALRQFQEEERLAQLLKTTLLDRQSRWKHFQKSITARARLQFQYLQSERGFKGCLTLNHKEKMLDLDVQPDETQTSKGRNPKTLSGGEKSFSTICLLLSLWEAMGAPIRCLDEFDVFMDSVNRQVSMGMMIMAARRSIGRQYILITPQSMSAVDTQDDVKIIKLSDPERNQGTLFQAR